ncbi:MAG: TIGR02587 family membrane protein [Chloroflexota bacterium]|nr:TIGR02587 family membrane protein [Chloroflexota bacterium]
MTRENPGPWAEEIHDLARGFSGAYLFGIPLLFTMEMWWIGQYADLWKLVAFLAIAFLANLGLAYFAGFEQESPFDTPIPQAVKAVAIGVVGSVAVLLVLNRIQPGDPLDSILGKIIIQAVPLSIGASVANAVFSSRGEGRAGGGGEEPSRWLVRLGWGWAGIWLRDQAGLPARLEEVQWTSFASKGSCAPTGIANS